MPSLIESNNNNEYNKYIREGFIECIINSINFIEGIIIIDIKWFF
jgi:hypothetical protein